MAWFGRRRRSDEGGRVAVEAVGHAAFQRFRAANPEVPPLAGWVPARTLTSAEVPAVGSGRVELWDEVAAPGGAGR